LREVYAKKQNASSLSENFSVIILPRLPVMEKNERGKGRERRLRSKRRESEEEVRNLLG
jgi:hypothetical protein